MLYVVELLSNLSPVTYYIYISAGAMQHLHAACICTHVASYFEVLFKIARRCRSSDSINTTTAVWVEIIQIVFLIMATGRFSQAAKRRQQYVRMAHLPVVHLRHHAHCCLGR